MRADCFRVLNSEVATTQETAIYLEISITKLFCLLSLEESFVKQLAESTAVIFYTKQLEILVTKYVTFHIHEARLTN